MKNEILVVDFGSQVCHLIASSIRRLGVYARIVSPLEKTEVLENARGLILSGGPSSVYDVSAPAFNPAIFSLKIPILAICYGHQLMAHSMRGSVKPSSVREYGKATLKTQHNSPLFLHLPSEQTVWMSHGDSVEKMPEGFVAIASTNDCPIAAMSNEQYFGLQFHPEVTHTEWGKQILSNFVFGICKADKDWSIEKYREQLEKEIRDTVKDRAVFMLLSGGVDSTVAYVLLQKVLGDKRVYGLHIDTGLMRKDESRQVEASLKSRGIKNFHVVDASSVFLEKLAGVCDPEEKRKIIGATFLEVKDQEVAKIGLDGAKWMLGQGTIYPDTIESKGSANADLIKTHHNRIDVIAQMIEEGNVVEPVADLYKDEVRELGRMLGISEELVERHPFPGPGLGIRVLCVERIEKIVSPEVKQIESYAKEFGLCAHVLPLKSVGVQGDGRSYRHPMVLEGGAEWDTLEQMSSSITNTYKLVNRALYSLGNYPWKDMKIKACAITKHRLDVLREADALAMKFLADQGWMNTVWQMPVVLIPVSFFGGESIVLRPVYSVNAMTVRFSDLPMEKVKELARMIEGIEGIDAVFYDVTHKPPGTLEWE